MIREMNAVTAVLLLLYGTNINAICIARTVAHDDVVQISVCPAVII